MAQARRIRSAANMSNDNALMFERLTRVIERLDEDRQMARGMLEVRPEQFKPPHYDGSGSVEKFIQHFQKVAQANQWTAEAALLHLKCALEADARNCGSADSIDGIFVALRNRFGLTPRQARAKLVYTRRKKQTSLNEHAARIDELVTTAYSVIQARLRMELAVDNFSCSLNNPDLQKHLLAVRPRTLEEAVSAGNEFLQIKASDDSSIRQVDCGDKRNQKVAHACWSCGHPGHMQRHCQVASESTQVNLRGQ